MEGTRFGGVADGVVDRWWRKEECDMRNGAAASKVTATHSRGLHVCDRVRCGTEGGGGRGGRKWDGEVKT